MRKVLVLLCAILFVFTLWAKEEAAEFKAQKQMFITLIETAMLNTVAWSKQNPNIFKLYKNGKHITTFQISKGRLKLVKGVFIAGEYSSDKDAQKAAKQVVLLLKAAKSKKQLQKTLKKDMEAMLSQKRSSFVVEIAVASNDVKITFFKSVINKKKIKTAKTATDTANSLEEIYVTGVFQHNILVELEAVAAPGEEPTVTRMINPRYKFIETVKMILGF